MNTKTKEARTALALSELQTYARMFLSVSFVEKKQSFWMRTLARLYGLLPGVSEGRFYNFTSFLNSTVYWSDPPRSDWRRLRTLTHELIHAHDAQNAPFWFAFSYGAWRLYALGLSILMGISAAVLYPTVIAFWVTACLSILTLLAALSPWSLPYRAQWEYRGYFATFWFDYVTGHKDIEDPAYVEAYSKLFTGPDYWYMDRDKVRVASTLKRLVREARDPLRSTQESAVLLQVLMILRKHSLLTSEMAASLKV